MEIYRRLLNLVTPHWRRLALAMICMLGVAACTAASAYLIKPVLDDIFVFKKMGMLKILPLLVLMLFVVKGVCAWGNAYWMSYVGQHIIAQLRQDLYSHMQTLSLSFFDRMPTGVLMSRITNDVSQLQDAVTDSITGLLKDSFSILGLTVVVFYRDWQLALIAMAVLPFAFYPIVKFGRMLRRISRSSQQSMGEISVILHETISGNRIVKAFGMEEYEIRRFGEANRRFLGYAMRSAVVKAMSSPIMEFLGGLGIVFIIWYGGYSVIQGVSTPGNFFSFLAALLLLYEPVKRLSKMNNALQQGVAAAVRVYEILDTEPEIRDRPNASVLGPVSRGISLRNVSFHYGDQPVLKGIHLEIGVGEVVAIVGVSGAGKTTLVNLIPRFYDVTEGAVLIDGTDIREVTLASLRSRIAMVTQQSILFNDTVRNNIAYGDVRKTDEEIIAAAKAANAYDFILRLPEGFDTVIGEQGMRLSGGERQRICIARALLKDAPILILDEATSSLDSESELEVQKALENLMAGRTTLVIAHRLSTVKNADRIIALVDGRIAEEGRHEELLRGDTEYRRLYELQFSQYGADSAG
ncbi:MAG TPA: lipid A export permease/ATP-binding protein MsbA [Syntrophobacteraceae bacterium]|nr:lipid A export permease/ATP-binding protein MsbA [Syntrophobacteraceae bacterium]